jgi:small-conductance mechanosensitive channel
MFSLANILKREFLGNSIQDYLISLGILILGIIIINVLKKIVLRKISQYALRTETKIDDFVIETVKKTIIPLLYFGVFYFSILRLTISPIIEKLINSLAVIILTIQCVRLVLILFIYFFQEVWVKREYGKLGIIKSKSILTIIKVVVWGLGIVFVLSNLGFNVSAIIAGLGIGGVAVALAAQTILGDLFNYFVIFFDKPFEEGDFIIIDNYLGVIEHIGIKTTRIRSLGGEQLVFSNSDLTSSRIRNYKRMEKRRVLFRVGVTYQTESEKLKKIPKMIKEIIENIEDTIFDRAHFQGFGDFSLDVEVVYYVLSSDYNKYMDTQEKINLAIKEAFEREGIEFAYPTQTIFLSK